MMKLIIKRKGGPGSGHFGHAGRPGKVGGSLPGKGSGAPATGKAGDMSSLEGKGYKKISDKKYMKRGNGRVGFITFMEDTGLFQVHSQGFGGRAAFAKTLDEAEKILDNMLFWDKDMRK